MDKVICAVLGICKINRQKGVIYMQKIKAGIINFWNDEEGMGTLEILLIVVVLVAVALLFSDQLTSWVEKLLENIDTKIPGE